MSEARVSKEGWRGFRDVPLEEIKDSEEYYMWGALCSPRQQRQLWEEWLAKRELETESSSEEESEQR